MMLFAVTKMVAEATNQPAVYSGYGHHCLQPNRLSRTNNTKPTRLIYCNACSPDKVSDRLETEFVDPQDWKYIHIEKINKIS